LTFGSAKDVGVYAAVGVSNTLLVLLFMGAHLVVYRWRLTGPYHDKSYTAARALVRFPSLGLFSVLFYYQDIVSSSLLAALYSPVGRGGGDSRRQEELLAPHGDE
jgi:hypothetical protein